MVNKDGNAVEPAMNSFQAAAAGADWNSVPGFGVILTNEPGAEAWPITAATFILIHKQPQDPAAAAAALKFFAWAYEKGDKMAQDLDYIPMPDNVVALVKKVWAAEIKDGNGKSLFAKSR
jgi:phosphate transport system substrate-binding protein